jgi:formate dehydrogenase assembly factor FdhD
MTTVVLNVKIDGELKEKLRQYAEENNENLGTGETAAAGLSGSGISRRGGVSEEDIDSQHTEEEASPLTPKEIKALRKILKKKNETTTLYSQQL